ncbi:MAG: threonine--tRNA ligase [Phycisphaerae bacterium]|nr:threonine--tRNA ligase [Phycisphaerae bacterium]
MPRITLPDGSVKSYDAPVTAAQVAADIGAGLAKAALGAKVDGVLTDLATTLDRDCALAIVTMKRREGGIDPEALSMLRHSTAHIMAEAIQRLFPQVRLVYGPALDTGFYYDMAFPDGKVPSTDDFARIEAEMAKIVAEDRRFTRYDLPLMEGMTKLRSEGSKYKLDNAERAAEAGSTTLSWYATGTPGKDWEDLCRGPHVPSTGRVGAFKVMSLASSYWKGDETSDRLTRVYGTAFASKAELDAHMVQLEEARKRDHRVLGKQLRLFHIDDMVGQGLILWTPKGSIIRNELQNFIGAELRKQGYQQVYTPHIGKLGLYRTSGHFPYYRESQYPPIVEHDEMARLAAEGCSCADLSNRMAKGEVDGYMLKPMNCPHHIRIFASAPHSYRDLPVRLAEFGTVYRWEQSGEIGGMTRVRGFTQDDAHLFVREDQVAQEVLGCLSLVKIIFATLGMNEYRVRVGLRDPDSAKYVGDPANWDKAEQACRDAARSLGVPFSEDPGEAAFYGPKIDFVVKDVIGRSWQLGTVQVDYNLPIRFDLSYAGADNQAHRPVMIHRAPFGSMERFIGCLIEHFAGAFPLWLSPEQVRVLPISEKSAAYADELCAALKARGIRAEADHSNERVQAKIKVAAEEKIPYMAVVGPRDAESRAVSVRARGVEANLGEMPFDSFVDGVVREAEGRLLSGAPGTVQASFAARPG